MIIFLLLFFLIYLFYFFFNLFRLATWNNYALIAAESHAADSNVVKKKYFKDYIRELIDHLRKSNNELLPGVRSEVNNRFKKTKFSDLRNYVWNEAGLDKR